MSQAWDLADALPPGSAVGLARVREAVAQGGEGIIYEADHPRLGKVLIKEYWPKAVISRARSQRAEPSKGSWQSEFRTGVERFHAVGERLMGFEHRNILRVHEVVADRNTAYLVMEAIEGVTLEAALQGGGFAEPAQVVELADQLTAALAFVHGQDVFHRDIAPDNLMVTAGYDWRLVLIDFNAAKDLVLRMTKSQEAVVKPGYSPIEQYDGDTPGPWTDIYAAAAVLYRVITGKPPMEAGRRLYRDQHRPLAELRPTGYAPAFLAAIDHGLQPRPDERPRSIAEWRIELGLDPRAGMKDAEEQPGPANEESDGGELLEAVSETAAGEELTSECGLTGAGSLAPGSEEPVSQIDGAEALAPWWRRLRRLGPLRWSLIALAAALLLLIALIIRPGGQDAGAVILDDDGPAGARTLADAIALAAAGEASVVHVRPGTYDVTETIDVGEGVVEIVGVGPRDEIILQQTGEGHLFVLRSSSILRNFTLRSTRAARSSIWIRGEGEHVSETVIDGLIIDHYGNEPAIMVSAGSPEIINSEIRSRSDPPTASLWIADLSDPIINNNVIVGEVALVNNSSGSITDNYISSDERSVCMTVAGESSARIERNTFGECGPRKVILSSPNAILSANKGLDPADVDRAAP